MFQRELLTIAIVAAALLVGVGAAGWLTVGQLHETSKMLVVDTLPGLVDSGLVEQRIHDNRHLMREMLFPHTDAERAEMIAMVMTNSTAPLWQDYARSIFEPEDARNYAAMILIESNYLQQVPGFIDLVRAGNLTSATTYYYGDFKSAFSRYDIACRSLFDYNVCQGQARGKVILAATSQSHLAIAALSVLVFLCGLAAGIRVALGRHSNVRLTAGEHVNN